MKNLHRIFRTRKFLLILTTTLRILTQRNEMQILKALVSGMVNFRVLREYLLKCNAMKMHGVVK
jgi:hypothetical protein